MPATADDSAAPVTGNDVVTVEARSTEFGGVTLVDVLANDSAADGEVLEICRVQAPERGLSVAEAEPDGGFTIDPGTSRAVVVYGGLEESRPDGRVRLAPGTRTTERVDRRAIRWIAFAPRTGQPIGEGVVRGIRLPGSSRSGTAADGDNPELTPRMLRAWRSS